MAEYQPSDAVGGQPQLAFFSSIRGLPASEMGPHFLPPPIRAPHGEAAALRAAPRLRFARRHDGASRRPKSPRGVTRQYDGASRRLHVRAASRRRFAPPQSFNVTIRVLLFPPWENHGTGQNRNVGNSPESNLTIHFLLFPLRKTTKKHQIVRLVLFLKEINYFF